MKHNTYVERWLFQNHTFKDISLVTQGSSHKIDLTVPGLQLTGETQDPSSDQYHSVMMVFGVMSKAFLTLYITDSTILDLAKFTGHVI